MKIKNNISLKKLNTFGIDANAERLIVIEDESDLENSLSEITSSENILILGGGSNILFTKDFDGTILKSEIKGIKEINKEKEHIYLEVGSGVLWDDLVKYAVNKGYGGIENLSLIPGTVGAAPIQNIGAYGVEFDEVFYKLVGYNLNTCEQMTYYHPDCAFDYRSSIFKTEMKNEFLITKVTIKLSLKPKLKTSYRALQEKLKEGKQKELNIKKVSELVREIRESKLPNPEVIGNAGSFFKNPIIDRKHFGYLKEKFDDLVYFPLDNYMYKIPAGWLIEQAGLKGKVFGNVGVHKKQALVLVNYGEGTGQEILDLAVDIQNYVYEKFMIKLETEVNII
ncbi:MAG: UDP-N-acetylmuramate dehydrogenase [Ignavibacteriae bacterium]|nr:UDP-N-acetylmuramate dehydrogenase [Ignavibacteriota bacterium]